jgi:hypothetical protein
MIKQEHFIIRLAYHTFSMAAIFLTRLVDLVDTQC